MRQIKSLLGAVRETSAYRMKMLRWRGTTIVLHASVMTLANSSDTSMFKIMTLQGKFPAQKHA
jgi:hypothetical protein